MSQQISEAFVKQYHDVIERLLQQKGSKLRNAVRQESQESEEQFWEQMDKMEVVEVVDRHGDSPLMDTPHLRRRNTLRQFDAGELIDKFDRVKMLIDPASSYVQNFVDGMGRKMDDIIIASFKGVAFTGKAGQTQVTFPGANTVAVNFGGAASNLTINKLIEARRILESFENDPDTEPWYVYASSSQKASLLKSTQVTSADYNSVRALVRGEVNTYLGLNFIWGERGEKSGNNRSAYVWTRSGVLFATGLDIQTEVARRADKRFSTYAYVCAQFGATRMQENKVLEILCDETV